jgi:uncharacterized membrane protein
MAAICFGAAAAVAAWLLWYAISEKPMAGCGPGSPCDKVMGSAWAYWLNIPVSAPALVTYLLLLGCAVVVGSKKPERSERAWNLGIILSVLVIATASWFVYLQLEVIKSVCKFCTATHLLSVCGAAIFLFKARRPINLSVAHRAVLAVLALMMFSGLVAGQKLAPHKTNVVSVYHGKFRMDIREAPVIGSLNNTDFIISLFDYTCPDCHDMHALLKAARERKTNSFSIISLPAPLDATCNPKIKVTRPKHKDACEYARVGLAMRKCGRDLFQKYDDWFFGQGRIPTLEAAREQAATLAGKERLEQALADPWVDQTLRTGINLYEEVGATTRSYRLPQIIIGDTVNTGPMSSLNELMTLLETRLHTASAMKR